MKLSVISMGYAFLWTLLLGASVFADSRECKAGADGYCVNVGVFGSAQPENIKNDFCFVLQLNGSDRFASGSIPMEKLPTALFMIAKGHAAMGKPLSVKLVEAQVVPSGQCGHMQANLKPVTGCEIFEYSVMSGISRLLELNSAKENTAYVCRVSF